MDDRDIELRVHTLESNHQSFVYELRQTNETLLKIEKAIEKQNEIHIDLRLLRQELQSHIAMEGESVKRQNARIEKLENDKSKIGWFIVMAVLGAILLSIGIKG